ncbi:glycosyltransferase family 4 protein [Candidatus Chloroploca asiatica]|uniref:Glycosyl transferase family 1 n=1 Tax=Candidatus Chloroploca asiatica TaxID=1506545 RepID=A0A2H3L2W7_9CHLR|nr:glycosyltransferase family 4 protein [Candidatus Chloroploca asiatica]PDV99107.1 glycosyl transferase family 1 [Candidatus Chloroploca asiatica]
MHILHLNQLYNPASGASRYFREIGARLVREGHRVTLLSTDALDLEYFWDARCRHVEPGVTEQDGMRIIRFPVQRMPGPSLAYQILRRLMVDLGRLGQPVAPLLMRLATLTPRLPALEHFLATAPELADVTVLHTTNITLDFAVIPAARWARQRGIRHLCTPFVHLGEPGKRQIVQYYTMPHQIALLQECAAVATMTTLERDALIASGVPAAQVHVVGAGIDPAEVAGGDGQVFRARHQISGPMVLSLGAAAYDKGTIHVLEAMQRLWASGVEATWVQCGPLLAHFEHYCKRLPAEARARIHVLGYVSDATRRDALAAATVYAQPSRTDSFGISYLEAWAYGVPVIGALAGGVPAVIRDGLDGLLVPFSDSAALAEALKRLISDPGYARQLGASGQARVMRELTWEAAYQRIRGLYEASLQR